MDDLSKQLNLLDEFFKVNNWTKKQALLCMMDLMFQYMKGTSATFQDFDQMMISYLEQCKEKWENPGKS